MIPIPNHRSSGSRMSGPSDEPLCRTGRRFQASPIFSSLTSARTASSSRGVRDRGPGVARKARGSQHRAHWLRATIRTNPMGDREIPCPSARRTRPGHGLRHLRRLRGLKPSMTSRVPGAGHDVLRSAEGHHPSTVYDKDPESGVRSIRDIKDRKSTVTSRS
jgi:hypothetical protein